MQDTSDLEFIEGVEDKLISIFLNDREAAIQGNSTLEVKDFYKSENQIIYSIIRNLIENGKNIDDIIVLEYIHANEDRQFSNYENYIHNALNEYSSSMNVNEYIDIIKKASIKRNLDKVCREIIDSKFDFSNFDDKISKEIKIFNDIA
jgi:replicative DNA helicase